MEVLQKCWCGESGMLDMSRALMEGLMNSDAKQIAKRDEMEGGIPYLI